MSTSRHEHYHLGRRFTVEEPEEASTGPNFHGRNSHLFEVEEVVEEPSSSGQRSGIVSRVDRGHPPRKVIDQNGYDQSARTPRRDYSLDSGYDEAYDAHSARSARLLHRDSAFDKSYPPNDQSERKATRTVHSHSFRTDNDRRSIQRTDTQGSSGIRDRVRGSSHENVYEDGVDNYPRLQRKAKTFPRTRTDREVFEATISRADTSSGSNDDFGSRRRYTEQERKGEHRSAHKRRTEARTADRGDKLDDEIRAYQLEVIDVSMRHVNALSELIMFTAKGKELRANTKLENLRAFPIPLRDGTYKACFFKGSCDVRDFRPGNIVEEGATGKDAIDAMEKLLRMFGGRS